jgi:hypothetical protein
MFQATGPTYSHFWEAVRAFQTLIASVLGLISVGGALVGIKLQSYLAARTADVNARRARVSTAVTIRSFLLSEANFPNLSLLETPTPKQVYQMLKTGRAFDLKATDYLGYLTTIGTSLKDFPRPISERASFSACVSSRVVLATAQAKAIPEDDLPTFKAASEEVRLLIIAGTEVAMALADELGRYIKDPGRYEKYWSCNTTSPYWFWDRSWKDLKSEAFDLENLRRDVSSTYNGTYARAEREGNLP